MAHEIRGFVRLEQGAIEEAGAEIEQAIRLVKGGLEAAPWGITQIGVYDRETKTYLYHCVPGWDPNLGAARGRLATVRIRMGDPEGALRALDVLPWNEAMQKYVEWIRQRIYLQQGRLPEAIPILEHLAADAAVTGEIRYNLGLALLSTPDHARAREFLFGFLDLASWEGDWRYPKEDWASDVETLVRLAGDLPSASAPRTPPLAGHEGVLLGLLLQGHGRSLASTRAFEAAFAAAPEVGPRLLPWPVPYPATTGAAQSALLAGWGIGADCTALGEGERARCRDLALRWMREGLAALRAQTPAWRRMACESWLDQDAYALSRDEANLKRLPPVEAGAWRSFWTDVRAAAAEGK